MESIPTLLDSHPRSKQTKGFWRRLRQERPKIYVDLSCGVFFPCDSLKKKRTDTCWISSDKWLRMSLEWAEKRDKEEVEVLGVFCRSVGSDFWFIHIIHLWGNWGKFHIRWRKYDLPVLTKNMLLEDQDSRQQMGMQVFYHRHACSGKIEGLGPSFWWFF